MKTIKYLIFSLILISIFSCGKDELKNSIELSDLSFSTYEDAKAKVGNFVDFFTYFNSGVTTESYLTYTLDPTDNTKAVRINTCFADAFFNVVDQKAKDGGIFYINNTELKYNNETKQYPVLNQFKECNEFEKLYGTENAIKFVEHNGNVVFNENLYFPKQFTNFKEVGTYDVIKDNPVITNRLSLAWNPDKDNTEGVALLLEWDGYIDGKEVLGRNEINKTIRRVLWVKEDLGSVDVPMAYFKGLPSNAIFGITIYRGVAKNITRKTADGLSYNFNLHNRIKAERGFRMK